MGGREEYKGLSIRRQFLMPMRCFGRVLAVFAQHALFPFLEDLCTWTVSTTVHTRELAACLRVILMPCSTTARRVTNRWTAHLQCGGRKENARFGEKR